MFCKKFAFAGDGVSTIIMIDLEKSPVGMDFHPNQAVSNYPKMAYAKNGSGKGCDVGLLMTERFLTVEFPEALAAGDRVDLELEFWYEGDK
jgi:hypothetical protein